MTQRELARRLRERALVLCDVEGAEAELMDPVAVPGLRGASLLVELHEFAAPGVTELLLGRFRPTHDIMLIDAAPKSAEGRWVLGHLNPKEAAMAVSEGRPLDPPMQWAVMTPHGHTA